MKKLIAAFIALFALLGLIALADGLSLPEGAVRIESEAFSDVAATWAYIPQSVSFIASDAFSPNVATIYGFRDTKAQAYASASGREFFDVGIYDLNIVCPPHVPAGKAFSVSAECDSNLEVSAAWELLSEGQTISSSSNGVLTMGQEGEFDIRLTLTNAYTHVTKLFPSAVSIMQPALPISSSPDVALGGLADVVSPEETRQFTLTSGNTSAISIVGTQVKGLKEGTYNVNVTVYEGEFSVTSRISVEVYPPATSISCVLPDFAYPGESVTLLPEALPEGAKYREVQVSLESGPAELHSDSEAEFTGVGTVVFRFTTRDLSLTREVPVVPRPTALAFDSDSYKVAVNGSISPSPTVYPEGSRIRLTWHSERTSVATVNTAGKVSGVNVGDSVITCSGEGLSASYTAQARKGYEHLTLSGAFTHMYPGESNSLDLVCLPADAEIKGVTWSSKNTSVATVDQTGRVTAKNEGTVQIVAKADSGVSASYTVRVFGYGTAKGISLGRDRIYVQVGQTKKLDVAVFPGGTISLVWSSSAPGTVSVDANGNIKGVKSGTATITAKMQGNSSVSASVAVNVLSSNVVLTMPKMKTGLSGIEANLSKINAVRNCAINETNSLVAAGKISQTQANNRIKVIRNAFDCLSFPWMTNSTQAYWKKENDENGLKIFRPGVVYYGMPYISQSYYNQRQYNPSKAISEKRYTLSSDGRYYILNQNNLYNGKYVGCDCSSFVAMCYYGTERKGLNTHWLATDSSFKTLKKTDELRPGDIIVKDYKHVVMFLYYANDEHTQIVIIENGGDAWATNTVSVNTYPVSYYYNKGFIPRRLNKW